MDPGSLEDGRSAALARLWLGVALVVALAGCRGDATGPGSSVARLQVTAAPDTVEAGSGTPATLRVRAVDGDDAPVEGLELRVLVLTGGGSVSPGRPVTDAAGEIEAAYLPGPAPGAARLRIDAPGAPDVTPIVREIVHRPPRRLILEPVEGDGQEAEAGSQLPRPFRVRVRLASGGPAAGERLTWTLADGPGDARVEPLSPRTDSAGTAAALLTLGEEPGSHVVRVHGTGSAATDTIRFTARGVASLASDIRVDSVRPVPLEPGSEATIHGEGFPGGAGVRVDGRAATVLESAAERVRIRVPAPDGCRPDRRVGVRVLAGEEMSNGPMVPMLGTGTRVDLQAGEIRTLSPVEASCVQLPPRDAARSLRVVVQSTARSGAGQLEVELGARAGGAAPGAGAETGASGPGAAGQTAGVAFDPTPDRLRRPVPRASGARGSVLRLQSAARRELLRRGVRPAERPAETGAASPTTEARRAGADLPAGATPPVDPGELMDFHFAVSRDLSVSCADTTGGVTARIRATRPSVVLAEDTAGAAGFPDEDHELLADEFHELVFPTDTAYFGGPTDLDGNGRVVVLFTPRVNELTPEGADAAVGGFFLPLDLAESGDGDEAGVPGPGGETCPASNEAEVLYLPVPDPAGVLGPEFSRAEALRNARGIVAHELMHLLSVGQRVVIGDRGFLALDEVWLAEALSHLAEEVVGFAFLDMEAGSALDFRDFEGSRKGLEAFNTFHLQNFGRLQLHLLDPASTPALALVDPGGVPSLQMRGVGWLFVRWLADRFASPATEAEFVRSLSVGGPGRLSGIENVTAATGATWEELLVDFALVPVLEGSELPDGGGGSTARRQRARLFTWRLRAAYEGLQQNPGARSLFPLGYPFRPEGLPFADARRSLTLRPAASAYFALEAATESPALALSLHGGGGTELAGGAALRLTLVRLR